MKTFHPFKAAVVAAALLVAAPVQAQTYPDKPVKLVLPYAPGGAVDYMGRVVAQRLGDALGQPVVAENRPGAGGMAGTDYVAKGAADGYTILLMDPAIVINPTLQDSVPYDLFKELKTVSLVSSSPLVLVTSPTLKVNTFQELVAYGKANPGMLNFASAGIGTTPHLAGEVFRQRTGVDAVHVPYRGIGASFADMVTGKVHMAFSSIAGAQPFTADGRLKAVATTGPKRAPAYPDLPTVAETGLKDFEIDLWLALFVPSGTPDAVVAKINTALGSALSTEEAKAAFAKVGAEARVTTPADGGKYIAAEYERWGKLIESAKLKQQ